ncbi:MAG: hypothetical protein EOP47_26730 [Sphingobacteriaceae bacterium]|nr:MAG: hypothetical protein EOP47_26730 [Sphingobacteriaceae bacterium]
MLNRTTFLLLIGTLCMLTACKKDKPAKPGTDNKPVDQVKPLYADSVFYVQNADYTVMPAKTQTGTYTAIPDGLELDTKTGAIDVNESETGLKYRVSFMPSGSSTAQTSNIIISGINYADKIYNLAHGDSIADPIYNADARLAIPDANKSTVFDEKGGCKKAGIIINKGNAVINLAQSVRSQGIDTGATEEVRMEYRINDKSKLSINELRVKIYFYRNVSEIPEYLTELLNERKKIILTAPTSPFMPASLKMMARGRVAGSRPPCVIVVSR